MRLGKAPAVPWTTLLMVKDIPRLDSIIRTYTVSQFGAKRVNVQLDDIVLHDQYEIISLLQTYVSS